MTHSAMLSSHAFEVQNRGTTPPVSATASGYTADQVQTPSPAATLAALLTPFSRPSPAALNTMIATSSPRSLSSSAQPDTAHALKATCLQQVWTEQSMSTHVLPLVDGGSHNPMHLVTNWPGSESLFFRSTMLEDPSYLHPSLLSRKPQSIVASSRTVSMHSNTYVCLLRWHPYYYMLIL